MSVPVKRTLVLATVTVALVLLGLLWGVLEPRTAPVWLANLSGRLVGGQPGAITAIPIRIAVAADALDRDGPGRSIVNGVRLFIEQFNARGGVFSLDLEVHDDQGDIETAQQNARRIVESDAVAVVGHRLTATSMAGGPVYRAAKLPAITPTATHPDVTRSNPWYFRTIYDDDHLGRFIVHYTDAVIAPDQTVIVAGSHAYGQNLAQIFTTTCLELDLPVVARATLDDEDPAAVRRQQIDAIVALLSSRAGRSVVFLATYPEEAVEVIRAIRDAGLDQVALVAPDSFDRPDLASLFDAFPNARRSPGFYTDGIDVATPLLYDTAGREAGVFRQAYRARFGHQPDWRAAYAYDSARAIAEALERADVSGLDLASVRRAIRDQLTAMDGADTGFEGITGPIFFTANRDVPRPAAIGSYRGRLLVSELTQFRTIRTLGYNRSVRRLLEEGKVIDIGGQLMRRVAIVYTGGAVSKVEIDAEAMTFDLVGRLWFRSSQPDLEPADIQILNAVGDVELTELDRLTTADGVHYERFRLAGTFRLDPVPDLRRFRQPMLGIAFRHRRLPAQELIYVVDLRGMGILPGTPPKEESKLLAQAIEDQGWQLEGSRAAYQDTSWVDTEGVPEFIDQPGLAVPFSTFVIGARVTPVGGLLSETVSSLGARGFLAGGLVILVTVALGVFVSRGVVGFVNFVAQFLALGLLLLAGEHVLFGAIEASVPFQQLETIAKLFNAAWWLLPAIYLVRFLNRFGWPYLEERSGRAVPRMIKLLCAGVILLLALFGVIGFVYQQPITSLLATSGLLGLIVGLAVQANIANVFAGIVLSAERPFALGDVIETEGHGVARVTDMTWRTTRMVTPTNLEISVPNSAIAEGFISNHSKAPVKTVVDVWLPPSLPIDWVTDRILEGIGRSERILREPAFGVEYGGVQVRQNQWAMNYQAYFFVDNGIESGAICSDVTHHVWQVLAEAGVTTQLGAGRPVQTDRDTSAPSASVLVHMRPEDARPSLAEPKEGHP